MELFDFSKSYPENSIFSSLVTIHNYLLSQLDLLKYIRDVNQYIVNCDYICEDLNDCYCFYLTNLDNSIHYRLFYILEPKLCFFEPSLNISLNDIKNLDKFDDCFKLIVIDTFNWTIENKDLLHLTPSLVR